MAFIPTAGPSFNPSTCTSSVSLFNNGGTENISVSFIGKVDPNCGYHIGAGGANIPQYATRTPNSYYTGPGWLLWFPFWVEYEIA